MSALFKISVLSIQDCPKYSTNKIHFSRLIGISFLFQYFVSQKLGHAYKKFHAYRVHSNDKFVKH